MDTGTSNYTAPLRGTESQVAVTVPRELVEQLDLDQQEYARYIPILRSPKETDSGDATIGFCIETRGVTGDLAHERALGRSSRGKHTALRWPLAVARGTGLHTRAAADTETTVRFEIPPDRENTLCLSMMPPCRPYHPPNGNTPTDPENGALSPVTRRLQQLQTSTKPADVHAYALELPAAYSRAYCLEKGQKVRFHVSTSDHDGLDLILSVSSPGQETGNSVLNGEHASECTSESHPERTALMGSQRRVQSRTIGGENENAYEQFSIHPPMALADALDLANTDITLMPRAGHIRIRETVAEG